MLELDINVEKRIFFNSTNRWIWNYYL